MLKLNIAIIILICVSTRLMATGDTIVKCLDSVFCGTENMQDWDFRSQSTVVKISQDKAISYTFIEYAKQDFRVFVCADKNLGDIDFKVLVPARNIETKIKSVNESEEVIYKLDEFGEQVLDSDDKPVILSKEVLRDTVWEKKVTLTNDVLFDSSNNSKAYWEESNTGNTRRITVLIIPKANNKTEGCVSILVGRKYNKAVKP